VIISSAAMPKAEIVFDHFHVIKMMNDKLIGFAAELHDTKITTLNPTFIRKTQIFLDIRRNIFIIRYLKIINF
jgi:Transposase